jgi:peptide/nickel transport system permease protein
MTDLAGVRADRADAAVSAPPEVAADSTVVRRRRRRRDLGALFGAAWLVLIVIAAALADLLPLKDPNAIGEAFGQPPDWGANFLGTDNLGRDVLSRCIYGARVSLAVGFGATTLAMVIGVAIGMVAGYFRGAWDATISLLVNVVMAFPPLIFLIALVSALRPSLTTLVLGLALLGVPNFARIARANTIAFAEREFVTASKALGASPFRVLIRELLVNVMLPVISLTLVVMAALVVAEGSLSFLGLGVPPPTPSWGGMLADGRVRMSEFPHLVIIPSVFFFLTVFAFNRLGDWARGRVGRESSL